MFLKLLRKYEYIQNRKELKHLKYFNLFMVKIRFRRISYKLGFSIPINTFGPGLSIPHYGTIVVNGNSRIGMNCRLHVGVNIGASGGSDKAPILGDNIYIGPGAILFGDIKIGDNVSIAANATVNKSFIEENNIVLAGTPAKIVKRNVSLWWENNRIKL